MCKWAADLLEQAQQQQIVAPKRLEYDAIHEDATINDGRWIIHIFDREAAIRRIEEAAERQLQRARQQRPRPKPARARDIIQLSFF